MSLDEHGQTALSQLLNDCRASWAPHHDDVPSTLYHYTSADGLIGILTSASLWATDLRYVNDHSELQYARGLVTQQLTRHSSDAGLSPAQRESLRGMQAAFDPFGFGNSVYAVSFCENGNLLSQWRTYRGRGGGYAIGIEFAHVLEFLSRPCVLRRVIYEVEQQQQLIDNTIDAFLTTVASEAAGRSSDDVSRHLLPAVRQAFASAVGELLYTFKHPDFREEREWRLVHFANSDPVFERGAEGPRFRSHEGNVIPFYAIGFERAIAASREDSRGIPFPIVELMIGPTIGADLNEDSTKALLLALNSDIEPVIRRSAIPLRWL